MYNIKGLFFDVGGTVFDWKHTARENIQKLADEKSQVIDSEAFATDWRGEMFKTHTQVRHENLPWINSDEMHLQALENLKEKYPLLTSINCMSLVKATLRPLLVLLKRSTVCELNILWWCSPS